jgi:hypothetical protein
LGAVKGLDLAFLVEREHHRVRRRIDIETDDVGELGGEGGIACGFRGKSPGIPG